MRLYEPVVPLVAALEVVGDRRPPRRSSSSPCRYSCTSAPSSCRRCDEGSLFYMPTTMPGISIGEAQKLLQVTDRVDQAVPGGRARARQGGARRDQPPIPRRSRCSRR